jgi:translation initiation factor 1A
MQQYKKHYKKNSSGKASSDEPKPEFVRVKLPRGREVIGLIEQRLGGNKMNVICSDKKIRNCRVPGRLKRALWLRPNDFVIVEPWEFDDEKGDVVFKYSPAAIQWLREHEHLKNIEEA